MSPSLLQRCAERKRVTTAAGLPLDSFHLTELPWLAGCTSSLLWKSWTCSVFQFKSIIKPVPISTAIKLSEPQINLAEREILLVYSDQYCSPGLEGAWGTLKAFGSASSLGGKEHYTRLINTQILVKKKCHRETRIDWAHWAFRGWSRSGAAILTSNWHWQSDSGSVSGAEGSGSQPPRRKGRNVCKTRSWEEAAPG